MPESPAIVRGSAAGPDRTAGAMCGCLSEQIATRPDPSGGSAKSVQLRHTTQLTAEQYVAAQG